MFSFVLNLSLNLLEWKLVTRTDWITCVSIREYAGVHFIFLVLFIDTFNIFLN